MEKQYIKRTCDSILCDTVETIEQGNENIGQMARWLFIISSQIVAVPQGPGQMPKPQLQQVIKQACRPLCAINIIKTAVEPPKEDESNSASRLAELQKLARGEQNEENQPGEPSKNYEETQATAPAAGPAVGSGDSLTA